MHRVPSGEAERGAGRGDVAGAGPDPPVLHRRQPGDGRGVAGAPGVRRPAHGPARHQGLLRVSALWAFHHVIYNTDRCCASAAHRSALYCTYFTSPCLGLSLSLRLSLPVPEVLKHRLVALLVVVAGNKALKHVSSLLLRNIKCRLI